ncbi:MAG: gliding motility-associated C-terminal domain-containing protein [Bacteroidetes bacterium]|nr:gliding motility-associated C-terminal domain-containing protein [Bacteroidota bacterium]
MKIRHTYTVPVSYDIALSLTGPDGCRATQVIQDVVTVYGYPAADFIQSSATVSVFDPSITFTDISNNAVTWNWDFGDGTTDTLQSPVHVYPDSGTYHIRLIVTSPGGCIDTTYGVLYVEQEFTFYAPNAFTPNGDGVNDGFVANGIGWAKYEMWILDRWGKEIYHSTDRTNPWDGSFYANDRHCQNDVYEYVIKVDDFRGDVHKYIGHVTLVR